MSKKIFLLINYSHETSGDVVAENIYELNSEEKAITKTSQLVNNGNGTSPYETVSGANLKYETKENAFNIYETKENAFNIYETQEYAAQTYETKVNVAIVRNEIPFSVLTFPGQVANAIRNKRAYPGGGVGSSSGKGSFFAGFVTDYQLGLIGANGDYSNIIGSVDSDATGKHTFIGGGVGCLARSYSETVFGTYPTDYTPVSESENAPEDRLINFGNGTNHNARSDAWTLFKNGAQKWSPKKLTTVTNAGKGFVAMDEDARVYTHDGIKWNKLALASEMNSYSTTETLTGGTWTNGKPIYRKTFNVTSSATSNPTTIDLSSLNVEEIVDLSGSAKLVKDAQTNTYIVNSVRALNGNRLTTEAYRVKTSTQDNIRIGMSTHLDPSSAGGSISFTYEVALFTITLEYTKTTN